MLEVLFMFSMLLTLSLSACAADVDTVFTQVHDAGLAADEPRTAVVLVHGYWPAATYDLAAGARLHRWQRAGSDLVESLGTHADVCSLGYGQDAPVGDIVPAAADALATLDGRYEEVVVVGHSAGGLLVRLIVEQRPDVGIDRVVQVCAPNGGTRLGRLARTNLEPQEPFVDSLSMRARWPESGAVAAIPEGVELVTVVCDGAGAGDGVVSDDAQWPPDLRAAGIPAVQLDALHFTAMRFEPGISTITRLATTPQPRWTSDETAEAEARIMGESLAHHEVPVEARGSGGG